MEKNTAPSAKKSPVVKVLSVVFILGMLWLVIANLPRGYSRDLTQIGKGKNVVVQVHDHNLVGSIDLMESLNAVRPEYAASVEFVVADLLTPEGRAFATTQNVSAVTLVFFAPDGTPLGGVKGEQDLKELRSSLNQAFNLPVAK